MKRLAITILLAIITILFVLSYYSGREDTYSYSGVCSRNTYASEIHCLTNAYRQEHGLSLLKQSNELESISLKKSKDMCDRNYFDHNYNGELWTRYVDEIEYKSAGENLAKGYERPSEAFDALIKSPLHKANIVGKYTHLGVFSYYCKGQMLTTQTFARL